MAMRPGSKIIILTAVIASLLEIIDSSIVNVAIPTMMGNLGTTLDEISWVSTAYMIANSIVLPIAAWLGTRFGRKKYFTSAISPRPKATPELVRAGIRVSAECGANGLTLGHYDGAWLDRLKAVKQGLDETGIVVLERDAALGPAHLAHKQQTAV